MLKVLQKDREMKKDCSETDDGIRAPATNQDKTTVGVDDALEILVHNATQEFGFAPRDVYSGVFYLPDIQSRHNTVVAGHTLSKLENLVDAFAGDRRLDKVSHHVVAVHPYESSLGYDDWTVDFKSVRIRTKVAKRMQEQERIQLLKAYANFCYMPEGSVLAGRIFEAVFHNTFTKGWKEGFAPQVFRMTSEGDPPVFKESSSLDTSLPPLRSRTRTIVNVDFSWLGDVTLHKNKLYIPAAVNNPLFDSFTIDFCGGAVVISIYQVTIAESHGSSSEGYLLIRQIIGHVRELLKKASLEATVEVRYFLVCPVNGSKHQWKMPSGWSKSAEKRNHRGKSFCMRVPLTERHAYFLGRLTTATHPEHRGAGKRKRDPDSAEE